MSVSVGEYLIDQLLGIIMSGWLVGRGGMVVFLSMNPRKKETS